MKTSSAFFVLIILCLLLLSGCTTAHSLTLPDGSQGQSIRCNGIQHSMNDCYEKAGEICPAGYDTLGGGEEYGPNSRMAALNGYNVGAIDRTLIVRCH